jgi:hypothetical protein
VEFHRLATLGVTFIHFIPNHDLGIRLGLWAAFLVVGFRPGAAIALRVDGIIFHKLGRPNMDKVQSF